MSVTRNTRDMPGTSSCQRLERAAPRPGTAMCRKFPLMRSLIA